MKLTVDLPEDLVRQIKLRAAEENRTYKDTFADLLRIGLARSSSEEPQIRNRMVFPVFKGGHPAPPGEEMTPERLHEILLEQEVESLIRGSGRG